MRNKNFCKYFSEIKIFLLISNLIFAKGNDVVWQKEYDYIIVGGGTAGSVLANRLSEDARNMILLLEAGETSNLITDIPLSWSMIKKSKFDWNYYIEKQDVACFAFKNRQITWPRGRVLGGSSVISNGIYSRGNRNDYENWYNNGAIDWSWADVFPYFLLSENNQDTNIRFNGFHGQEGYLNVQKSPFKSRLGKIWPEVGRSLGYTSDDINGKNQSGFVQPEGTLKDGTKQNMAKAYLLDVKNRPNLHILLNAHVTKIIFNKHKRAIGVKYLYKMTVPRIVRCRNEVILAAGTIGSAQTLLLSGIGPVDHLQSLNIPVIMNLPVGENLQDHVYVSGIDFKVNKLQTLMRNERIFSLENIEQFTINNDGPLTSFGGIEGIAFVNSEYNNYTKSWPDIQLLLMNGNFNENRVNLAKKYKYMFERIDENFNTYSVLPVILRPKSRGYIRLRSKNPMMKPMINPNYLTHPDDILTMVAAMKLAISVGEHELFKTLGSEFLFKNLEDCDQYRPFSSKYLACWARVFTNTMYDPVGTCRMGPEWDPESVVDMELKVYGVTGLRVIDASIMPTIISGNVNAATVMIAERGADFIKGRKLKASMLYDNDINQNKFDYFYT